MNKDGSNNSNLNPSTEANFAKIHPIYTSKQSAINRRINELTDNQTEYNYWQNKVLDKNVQILKDTLEFSKKKGEMRSRVDRLTRESAELKNKINELENSIVNDKEDIESSKRNLSEINQQIPQMEKDNIDTFNEVRA